jgi:ribosomal protein S2
MKINFIKTQNYKLFKYKLLKLQTYTKPIIFDTPNLSNTILDQIETYFKQVLKVIFEYHMNHLKILFIGFPIVSKKKQKKLIHFSNHNFIPEKSWISGIFRNRFSVITYLKLLQSQNFSKNVKLLLAVKTKPHLVVIFNHKIDINAVNELYKINVPILSFNCSFLQHPKITYKILGNFDFVKKNIKTIYFFLFYALLKKTPLSKKRLLNSFKIKKK